MSGESTRKNTRNLSQIHGEKCWPMVDELSPCEEACPLHMDIPSYVMALAQGRLKEALEVVRDTNPFPSICGRVCHHPCEDACSRAVIDEPIAIEWLKRCVGDYALNHLEKPNPAKRTKEERVAVIGSGPAGLTAAHDLVLQGYAITVYEALDKPGGILAAGIPEFILPARTVEAEIDYIKALGVHIKTGMAIGRDMTLDDLLEKGYGSILLATGAWKSLQLSLPGVDKKGVIQALPFLQDVKLGKKTRLQGTVVVIGGGNVAIDAARTALRLGASDVRVACLEPRVEMPAFLWEVDAAEQEGVHLHPSLAPQKCTGKPGGRVGGIEFRKVANFTRDSEGKINWVLREGPESEIPMDADTVIIAIGQVPDTSFALGLGVTEKGTFEVDPATLATKVAGLFAAGDSTKIPGTVTEAISLGHKAAKSIERYLRGEDLKSEPVEEVKASFRINKDMVPPFLIKKDRWDMPSLSLKDSIRSFEETMLGYTTAQMREEAKRCLNCRMCRNCIFERGQLCFEAGTRLL